MLWLYTPVTYGLDGHACATVYHCGDLLGTFPGIDAGLIERAERTSPSQEPWPPARARLW